MLEDLKNAAVEELEKRIKGSEYTATEAEKLIRELAQKQVPKDPTKILMVVSDDYRLLTWAPVEDTELKEETDITPTLVIQYLIREAIEDALWEIIELHIIDDDDG